MRAKKLNTSFRKYRDETRMRPSVKIVVSAGGTVARVQESGLYFTVYRTRFDISKALDNPEMSDRSVNRTET